jgi:hypothetical protein
LTSATLGYVLKLAASFLLFEQELQIVSGLGVVGGQGQHVAERSDGT